IEDAGGVPLSYGNVPTSYVGGGPKDAAGDLPKELEQDLPEPPPEPKGSVYPQPIAVSLNKERPMPSEQEHFDAARKFQEFYDNTLRKIGMRAPQPVLGDTVNNYRRETLRTLKRTFLPQNHELYQIQFRGLPADVLNPFEAQLLQACVVEANNPQ